MSHVPGSTRASTMADQKKSLRTPPTSASEPVVIRCNEIVDDVIARLTANDEHSEMDHERHDENEPLLLAGSTSGAHKECKPNRNDPSKMDPSSSSHSVFIYIVTFLSAIGGFLFGYDTGIVSGAMVFIRDYFHLSNFWQELIVSATILAAWIFSLTAGYLTNAFGRKWVVILASAIFTIGGFMMALANTKELLLAGRFTVGIAIGLASMVVPVYIAEVAPAQIRGKLVIINVCFITFGQFVASILAGIFSSDPVHGWRWMLGIASVPSFIQMVFFVFLPESPRWLIQKGRYDEAFTSLSKFRSNTTADDINIEFDSIKNNFLASQREEEHSGIGRVCQTPSVRRSLFVGCIVMMFQQLAGINTVMYYSATIIQMSGVHDKSTAVWMSAATASVNFIFTFVGLALVERLGRRLLIMSSLCGVILSLLVLGVGFQLAENNSPAITFHAANQSVCSTFDTCNQCVRSKCGFCFFEGPNATNGTTMMQTTASSLSRWQNQLLKPELNGTCLLVDPLDTTRASGNSFCSNGTEANMVWATNWCPSNYSWMTLVGLMLYLFFFAPGAGPGPWVVTSEIYPLWARGLCCSISTSVNWFFNLLVSLTFLSLTEVLTNHGTYYLYAGIAFIGWLAIYVFLPETKGKSLEEIELLFDRPLLKLGTSKEVSRSPANSSNSTGFVSSAIKT